MPNLVWEEFVNTHTYVNPDTGISEDVVDSIENIAWLDYLGSSTILRVNFNISFKGDSLYCIRVSVPALSLILGEEIWDSTSLEEMKLRALEIYEEKQSLIPQSSPTSPLSKS